MVATWIIINNHQILDANHWKLTSASLSSGELEIRLPVLCIKQQWRYDASQSMAGFHHHEHD